VHVTAVLAQALAKAYYGNEPAHAYFRGCSTGGRQALVAATRNPDDFDGIIAGAPFDQRRSVPFMIWADAANTGADGRPLLKRQQFELLHKAALEACDGDDGQLDGIIGNPAACSFQPEVLACSGAVDASCLGPEQLAARAAHLCRPRRQQWAAPRSLRCRHRQRSRLGAAAHRP
jgi:pimeloyl-ACP methyl ester carboxylesterase